MAWLYCAHVFLTLCSLFAVVIPADPANVDSETQIVPQAGQVWYPDSAFKTAQAIKVCFAPLPGMRVLGLVRLLHIGVVRGALS